MREHRVLHFSKHALTAIQNTSLNQSLSRTQDLSFSRALTHILLRSRAPPSGHWNTYTHRYTEYLTPSSANTQLLQFMHIKRHNTEKNWLKIKISKYSSAMDHQVYHYTKGHHTHRLTLGIGCSRIIHTVLMKIPLPWQYHWWQIYYKT